MFKKYIAIIFLCISNFILVGHNLVPHHHVANHHHDDHEFVDEHAQYEHHHHPEHKPADHHDHQDDEQSSGLSDLLAFVNHSQEYIGNDNEVPSFEQNSIKDLLNTESHLFALSDEITFPSTKNHSFYYRDPDYFPPPNSYKSLRAPPVFFS